MTHFQSHSEWQALKNILTVYVISHSSMLNLFNFMSYVPVLKILTLNYCNFPWFYLPKTRNQLKHTKLADKYCQGLGHYQHLFCGNTPSTIVMAVILWGVRKEILFQTCPSIITVQKWSPGSKTFVVWIFSPGTNTENLTTQLMLIGNHTWKVPSEPPVFNHLRFYMLVVLFCFFMGQHTAHGAETSKATNIKFLHLFSLLPQ